jgi:hypothetical protein
MHGTVPDIRRDVMKTRAIISDLEHTVTSAHTMVSDMRRAVVGSQGGIGGKNPLVSDTYTWPSPNDRSPLHRLKRGQ